MAGILTICAEGFKSGPPLVTIQPIEHRAGGPLVRSAHDVVAIEDRPRVLWPVRLVATRYGSPPLTSRRTANRRRSC